MEKQGPLISPAPPPLSPSPNLPLISPAPPPLSPSPNLHLKKRKRKKKNETASKICVICNGSPYTDDGCDEGDRTHVYVLNLNSNTEVSVEPILRIRYSQHWSSTCVVNSTIYFIEGLKGSLNHEFRKSVFFYKLPSSQPTPSAPTPVIDYTSLEKTAPMTGIKCRPMGIPTPDYKAILVFSKLISVVYSECVNFELYNLATNSWNVLPELFPCLLTTASPPHRRSDCVKIRAYGFVDESIFLIQTEDDRIFTLNLESPENWKLEDRHMFGGMGSRMGSRRFTDRFFGLGNGLVMDFSQIYNIHSKKNIRIPPPEGLKLEGLDALDERHNWYGFRRSMTLLPSSSADDCRFCALYPLPLHVSPGVFFRPRFCINVHRFDPATCFDNSTSQYQPINVKSFEFVFANYQYMHVTRIYPMEQLLA